MRPPMYTLQFSKVLCPILLSSVITTSLWAQNISVDASNVIRTIPPNAIGINVNYLMDGTYISGTTPPATTNTLKNMNMKFLRYPGGEKSDNFLWSVPPFITPQHQMALPGNCNWPSGDDRFVNSDFKTTKPQVLQFDDFITMCVKVGAEPMIVCAYDAAYYGTAIGSPTPNPCGTKPTVSELVTTAKEWVRYANMVKGYNIKYWCIGNESYRGCNYNGCVSAAQYAVDIQAFAMAMRSVDPTIKIIVNGQGEDWWKTLLESPAAAHIDYFGVSCYPVNSYSGGYNTYRSESPNLLGEAQTASAAINQYAAITDNSRIKVITTEFNSMDIAGVWPNTNDVGHALVSFEIMGQNLSNVRVDAALLWNTRWVNNITTPQEVYDALDQNSNLNANGLAMSIWGNNLLPKLISSGSSDVGSNFIKTFSLYDDRTNRLNLFVINKDNTNRTVNINISGFVPNSYCSRYEFKGTDDTDKFPNYSLMNGTPEQINAYPYSVSVPRNSITVFKFQSSIGDNTPPTITPKNITVNADVNGQATIQPSDVIQSITDNSGVDNSSIAISQSKFNCPSSTASNTVSHQAYIVTTTIGTQNFGGELGMEFKVNNASGITINQLGAFDHQGNGITGTQNGGVRVAIFNKVTKTIVPGLDVIVIGNADAYSGNHRMKNITAVTLMPGDYVVVAKGYNQNELNGNSEGGVAFASGDLAGGAISYASSCLYGSTGSGFAYPSNPDGGPGNRYLAGTFSYSTVSTTTNSVSHQAYIATTTTGTQNFGGELGMEFKVNNAAGIIINQLGAFDHQGNGITGTQSGGVRVAVFNKVTKTIVPGLDVIVIGNADAYSGNYRMKNITAVTLMPGDYVVVAKGYNQNELNGNSEAGTPFASGDLAGGAISYASSCLYGSAGSGFAYPSNPDGGPGNRYLAGTFSYSTASNASNIVSHQAYIATTTTGTQNFGGELGMEFKVNNTAGITINQLGAFDHEGNGITGTQSGGVRVAVFNKATQTIVAGLDALIIGNADGYSGNHRMKNITPVTLMPGYYVVVAKGYNQNELNGNFEAGTPFASGDLAGGAISYASSCLYGSTASGFAYPSNPDGGPGNRYLAGTFSYSTNSGAISNNSNTIVTITAKDIYGNVGQATATVTLVCNQSASAGLQASVSEQTLLERSKTTLKISPNPTSGQFSVQLSRLKVPQVSIQIVDGSGKLITQKSMSLNGTTALKLDFSLRNQSSGTYVVKVISSEGVLIGKVILLSKN